MKRILLVILAVIGLVFMSLPVPADLNNGLVAYYPFNDNADDESGNELNGYIYGGILPTVDRNGVPNSAYEFDGVDDYIKIPHDEKFNFKNEFTISAWILSNCESTYMNIFTKSDSTGWHPTFGFFVYSNSEKNALTPRLEVDGNGGGSIGYVVSPEYPDTSQRKEFESGKWTLFTVTYSNKVVNFYVNDKFEGTKNILGTPPANDLPEYIGIFRIGDERYAKGAMDDIRIYNRALSPAEVSILYTESNCEPKYELDTSEEDDRITNVFFEDFDTPATLNTFFDKNEYNTKWICDSYYYPRDENDDLQGIEWFMPDTTQLSGFETQTKNDLSWLTIRTEKDSNHRMKIMTKESFKTGVYEWRVFLPSNMMEDGKGANTVVAAWLYSINGPEGCIRYCQKDESIENSESCDCDKCCKCEDCDESCGCDDCDDCCECNKRRHREIDFEVGWGPKVEREKHGLKAEDPQLVLHMQVQPTDHYPAEVYSVPISIKENGWYTFKLELKNVKDKYKVEWYYKNGEESYQTEPKFDFLCSYGPQDTSFNIACSVENFTDTWLGENNPPQENHCGIFEFVKYSKWKDSSSTFDNPDSILVLDENDSTTTLTSSVTNVLYGSGDKMQIV